MKQIIFLFITLLINIELNAQSRLNNRKFGNITKEEFKINVDSIEKNADAFVISDIGSSYFIPFVDEIKLIYKRHLILKINTKNGFDAATIKFLTFHRLSKREFINKLKGFTYNLENDKIIKTEIDKNNIFSEDVSKNWNEERISFPNIKEGSIIELVYEIESPFLFNWNPWTFQNKIPTLYSAYTIYVPSFCNLIPVVQSAFNLKKTQKQEHSTLANDFTNIDNVITWEAFNLPPIYEEPYITSIENFETKVKLIMQSLKIPGQTDRIFYYSWEETSRLLEEEEDFGDYYMSKKNWLHEEVKKIIGNETDKIAILKKIYYFIKNNFSLENSRSIFTTKSIKNTFNKKSGTISEINLILIAMLKELNYDAKPVLISTVNNGRSHPTIAIIEEYNYLICIVTIDEELIFLDASDKYNVFGMLPKKCYNGGGHIVSKENSETLNINPKFLIEQNKTLVNIFPNEDELKINIKEQVGIEESIKIKKEINAKGIEKYKKIIQENINSNIILNDININYNDTLANVTLYKNGVLKPFTEKVFYFNPLIINAIQTKLFTNEKRTLPIEMPYLIKNEYLFNFQLPSDYFIEDLPKSEKINFNTDEIDFIYLTNYEKESNNFQLTIKLNFNNSLFYLEDYSGLHDFFSHIIKKCAEIITIKKHE